jgi:S-adenosylmethionine-diacylglycerol 3-amino-3-carboxypropyl transferase
MHEVEMNETVATGARTAKTASPLKRAAIRSSGRSREGLLERLFAFAFDGLVYPQICEDPAVDMAAMELEAHHHVVAIASGGCNVMSYLTASPARITAVDLNLAHLSLLELKLKAARHLPSHQDFTRFFADAASPLNPQLFDLFIEPHLTSEARRYWCSERTLSGRRIELFARGFYRHGLLGRFIWLAHAAARLYGVNPAEIMQARSLDEQRWFFAGKLAPLFERKFVRWLTSSPVSLYGLGIPPAQYAELSGGRHMADVLCERLGELACAHPLADNYFARQAFGRCYGPAGGGASLPPYLEAGNWATLKANTDRVRIVNNPITDVLAAHPGDSVDRVVLLDAQDWMDEAAINALWSAITRTARPGARVIFRTAAPHSPLEQKLDAGILGRWAYDAETSRKLAANDRSAIYGGFHLYRLRG